MPSKYPARGRGSRAKVCRECGRHRDQAGSISARGLCSPCAHGIVSDVMDQLRDQQGPHYEEWRRQWVEGMRSFVSSL